MLRIISGLIAHDIEVRIIGKVEAKWNVKSEKFPGKRLHVRAMIRDGRRAFVGSQSLRRLELEKRREIGVVVTDENVVRQMQEVFENDWALTDTGKKQAKKAEKKSEKAEKRSEKRTKKRTKKEEKLAKAS
jgi:phosphatidylserine/phosphatidylglycerophosphate/cardiolipin synthase-like enzyme